MAHVLDAPALTASNLPAGEDVWPWSLRPQHLSVPSVAMAQL
jgi:hypothetical protein